MDQLEAVRGRTLGVQLPGPAAPAVDKAADGLIDSIIEQLNW